MGVMIAFFLPETSAQALYDQAVAAGLTPTAKEQMHVTLCYLGETDAIKPFRDAIDKELTELVQWIGPVEGTVNGIGRFSGETEDVFYASVDAPLMGSVQRAVYAAMRWSDVPVMQTHGFQPHVTLSALATDADTPNLRATPVPIRFGEIVLAFDEERTVYPLGVKEGMVQEEVDKHLAELRAKVTAPMISAAEMNEAAEIYPRIRMAEALEDRSGRHRIQMTLLTEISGPYPEIKLPADVDTTTDPLFVTLPVGQIDARSQNRRNYRRAAMENLRDQVNERRPEGMWGHLRDDEISTEYKPPAIRWLAAVIDEQGIVWAKGRPLTDAAREYYRLAKLDNARVGTSIFAWAEMEGDDVIGLDLITIDLADPARVGIPMTAARPLITTEMTQDTEAAARSSASVTAEAARSQMPDEKPVHSIQEGKEMPTELEQAQSQIDTLREQVRSMSQTQQTQSRQIADFNRVAELLNKPEDVVLALQAVIRQRDDLKAENADLLDATIDSKVAEQVKVEAARPIIVEQVKARNPVTRTDVTSALSAVMSMPSVKELLKYGLQKEMGDPQPANRDASNTQAAEPVVYTP